VHGLTRAPTKLACSDLRHYVWLSTNFIFADSITEKSMPPRLTQLSFKLFTACTVYTVQSCLVRVRPMRPMARGLAPHGGPPGWREEGDPQVWFCTWWTGHISCLFRTVPVALTGAAQVRADGISSCRYKVNLHNYPSRAIHHLWVQRKTVNTLAYCRQQSYCTDSPRQSMKKIVWLVAPINVSSLVLSCTPKRSKIHRA
jgi:hypothetical protein